MEVICLEDNAYFALLEQSAARLIDKYGEHQIKWLNDAQAMQLLNIKSHTTLQKLRDEGKIRFSQPQKRIILYDRASLNEYLEHHARNTF